MIKKYRFILFMSFFLMGGCSTEDNKTTSKQSGKPSIFSDQLKALEKAKAVEQVIQTGIDKRNQTLDE